MVSPHYDDAPLSVGQSMLDGALANHSVTVGIVFGRSNWTRWFHPTRGRMPAVTAIRYAEERLNAHRFGYRVRTGGLEEAILRLGTTDTTEFLDPGYPARDTPEREAVARMLMTWTDGVDGMLLPLGVGGHIDHRIVAAVAPDLTVPVAFYEDRPYACGLDDEALAAIATSVDPTLRPRTISGPITEAKTRRLWYPSQFDPFFVDAMGADIADRRLERIWVRDSSHPLAHA